MLASQISTYPENAVKAFKNEVDDPIGSLALPEDKAKWWCVLMTIITRWMTERTHKESTKTIMAKILIKLHATFKDTREVRFKELARRLDFQGKKVNATFKDYLHLIYHLNSMDRETIGTFVYREES